MNLMIIKIKLKFLKLNLKPKNPFKPKNKKKYKKKNHETFKSKNYLQKYNLNHESFTILFVQIV